MGGALILVSITVTTLLWGDLANRFVWVTLLVTVGFGAIGWVDDYRKVVHRNPKGLSARTKFLWQSVIGLVAAVYLAFSVSAPDNARFVQLFLAWIGSGFNLDAAAEGRPDRPVLQDDLVSARRLGLHRAHLLRDRRHQQRGQPDRRPRRPRDHADGDDRRGARHLRLRERQRDLRALPAVSVHPRRRRARRDLRRDGGRRARASSGSTPIRRKCSWATSARSRSARRSARSR